MRCPRLCLVVASFFVVGILPTRAYIRVGQRHLLHVAWTFPCQSMMVCPSPTRPPAIVFLCLCHSALDCFPHAGMIPPSRRRWGTAGASTRSTTTRSAASSTPGGPRGRATARPYGETPRGSPPGSRTTWPRRSRAASPGGACATSRRGGSWASRSATSCAWS